MESDERPWGGYRVLLREPGFQVKRIEVKPGKRFSLQKHLKRSEKWVVVAGVGKATVGREELPVQKGSVVEIDVETVHRLENTGKTPLVIVEVQFGKEIEEGDVVRLEDDFGRVPSKKEE